MKDKSMVTIPLKEYEKLKENEERLVHILESIAEDIGRFERLGYWYSEKIQMGIIVPKKNCYEDFYTDLINDTDKYFILLKEGRNIVEIQWRDRL